ncbi:MAG: MFS transporter, partial [Actinomycetia bacterium]|nr:MFS transporter [Actinomycetes bacterium]
MSDIRSLRAVATQFWINGMVFASFIPRLPEIRDRIEIDLATLGLLLTLGSLGGLAGSAICGPVIQRFGTRRAMIGG